MDDPSWMTAKAGTSSENALESSIKKILDYFGLDTELSVLVDSNLKKLWDKYFSLECFQLIAPTPYNRVMQPPKGCIAFYDKALWSELRFPLYHFICNILDFCRLHPTQITPTTIKIVLVFIICCSFVVIELRISFFKMLYVLKKHPTEKGW